MFGNSLISKFGAFSEIAVHGHVPEERAMLYSAIDGCSTEIETLNFLNALVISWKPKLVIETGAFRGFGTIAIAAALKTNGFGKVYTCELDPNRMQECKDNVEAYNEELLPYIEFVCGDSLDLCRKFDHGKIDFAFLDSETWLRYQEFEILRDRGMFSEHAVMMTHDTSRLRSASGGNENSDLNEALDALDVKGSIEFPFSRGFRVFQL